MSNYKEHAAMVDQLCKPGERILADLTAIKAERLHMVVGLMGETTELASGINQLKIYEDDSEYQGIITNIVEEFGDCEFYLEGLCQTYGIERIQPSHSVIENSVNDGNLLSLLILTGDLLDKVKKDVIYNKDIEVSGALFCVRVQLDALYMQFDSMGITPERARAANLKKLLTGANARFKAGQYSNRAAQERADKKV